MTETITAQARAILGKKVRSIREGSMVPAVLYGPELKRSIALSVDLSDFQKVFSKAHHNAPITIAVSGEDGKVENHQALIHTVATDPVRGTVLHVDFYQFSAKKKVHIEVPIVLEGTAPAQKLGALIMKNLESIEVECSPLHIPESIRIDVSGLSEFDQTIYGKDIVLPEGVTTHLDAELPVVSAVPPISEAELAAMETKSKEPLPEPELAGKKEKKEEEEATESGEQKPGSSKAA